VPRYNGFVRFRIRAIRAQVAERTVRAPDEEAAVRKVQEELAQPYAFLGRWETTALEVEIVGVEASLPGVPTGVDGGPLLLSVQEAAKHLGISRGLVYELVNSGEIESIHLGRRRLISRDAINRFVESHSRADHRP
jgi:excisionase family DNA binding protein